MLDDENTVILTEDNLQKVLQGLTNVIISQSNETVLQESNKKAYEEISGLHE